jgi:hypothetical protein
MEKSPASCCNKTVELPVKLPSEEILHSKSGWLMKEDRKEWSKYWFSLKGGGLFYYRDPAAEERGVFDGVLDVNSITSIKETTTNRNHSFQLTVINVFNVFLLIISLFFSHLLPRPRESAPRFFSAHDGAIFFDGSLRAFLVNDVSDSFLRNRAERMENAKRHH